jgi:hypothetical protein
MTIFFNLHPANTSCTYAHNGTTTRCLSPHSTSRLTDTHYTATSIALPPSPVSVSFDYTDHTTNFLCFSPNACTFFIIRTDDRATTYCLSPHATSRLADTHYATTSITLTPDTIASSRIDASNRSLPRCVGSFIDRH